MNNPNSKKAAVLIHGFLGHAGIFDFLLPTLQQNGWTVIPVTLPGHGKDLADFVRHNAADWQRHVDEQLRQVGRQYDQTVVITHSMGGLLTLCSRTLPKNAGVFALALPLHIRMTPSAALTNLRAVLPAAKKESPSVKAAREQLGVSGLTPLNAVRLLPNLVGLLKLSRSARHVLKQNGLHVRLSAVFSANDGMVSLRSEKFLRQQDNANIVRLKESEHFLYTHPERAVILEELRNF